MTDAPTKAPTNEILLSFTNDIDMVLEGGCGTFSGNDVLNKQTIAQAMAISMGIDPEYVEFIGCINPLDAITRHLRSLRSDHFYTGAEAKRANTDTGTGTHIGIDIGISTGKSVEETKASRAVNKDIEEASSVSVSSKTVMPLSALPTDATIGDTTGDIGSSAYSLLVHRLETSVKEGALTATMKEVAIALGAGTEFSSVSATGVKSNALEIVYPPSLSPTVAPTDPPSVDLLADAKDWGVTNYLVVAAGGVCLLLVCIVGCLMYYSIRPHKDEYKVYAVSDDNDDDDDDKNDDDDKDEDEDKVEVAIDVKQRDESDNRAAYYTILNLFDSPAGSKWAARQDVEVDRVSSFSPSRFSPSKASSSSPSPAKSPTTMTIMQYRQAVLGAAEGIASYSIVY